MTELFNSKFVHCVWTDELEGKECFLEDNIGDLIHSVEINYSVRRQVHFGGSNRPFDDGNCEWRFAYYDPNYEVKYAFYKEGKTIQFRSLIDGTWHTCDKPTWLDGYMYRVKLEEEKWIVYLCRSGLKPYLTSYAESQWEFVQKEFGAKTKLFVGTDAECVAWYKSRQKFTDVIKAWEDGKQVQFNHAKAGTGWCPASSPTWNLDFDYRTKPADKIACVHKGVNTYYINGFIDGSIFQGTKEECEAWIGLLNKRSPQKRMTYRQLAEWLAKGNGEYRPNKTGGMAYTMSEYRYDCPEAVIPEDYNIRHWGSDDWLEPTVDIFIKDCRPVETND